VRVLVVEDCQPLADLVVAGLSDQGIAADVAYDGTEAAGKLAVNSYDVVVLDRTLPGVPGDTLCRMIGGSDGRTMVLMLSGAASPEERVHGLALGADDYLVKPFHFPELVMRVRALARCRPRAMPRVLRAGGLELDGSSRIVRRHGCRLALSAKELAVLEALMAASPGYLSAEQLLEKAWDENADPFTKTVTVTIGRLRRKLGEPQVIETAGGVGYRLVGPQRDECLALGAVPRAP
jgi:DNA-binding response OmpR family regulator